MKKTQRAAAQVAGAASAYAEATYATSGMESPFAEVLSPGGSAARSGDILTGPM
ncbi:MAG: hypothetical protein H7288_04630 [Kineosporiaceae bacterium]|nr:hypothetical protein [Aeromicrobium sp.]